MYTQESGYKKKSQNKNKSSGANISTVSCYTDVFSDITIIH